MFDFHWNDKTYLFASNIENILTHGNEVAGLKTDLYF